MGNLLARVRPVLVVRFEITTGKAGRAWGQIRATGVGVQTNVVPWGGTSLVQGGIFPTGNGLKNRIHPLPCSPFPKDTARACFSLRSLYQHFSLARSLHIND